MRDTMEQDDIDDVVIPLGLLQTLGSAPSTPTQQEEDSAVSSLLIAQAEVADVLLLNKVDLVDDTSSMEDMLRALNPPARVFRTEYGRLPCHEILGSAKAQGVVTSGIIDDHKDAVKHATEVQLQDHQHHHSHSSGQQQQQQQDHHATEHGHRSHSHAEDNHKEAHGHQHNHHASDDASSSHSHNHVVHHDDTATCTDPDCTDTSHSHSHHQHTNIGSFVYRARRPFHPERLAAWFQHLPVVQRPATVPPLASVDAATRAALQRIVRSKGFYWQADSHAAALYWSQAGSALELRCIGGWWATLPRYRWPAAAADAILTDFDDPAHAEDDVSCSSVGDRRQEIVLIGSLGSDASAAEALICRSLDTCLLTDEEWDLYRTTRFDETALQAAFRSPLKVHMMSM